MDERCNNPGAAAGAVVDVWKELVYQAPGDPGRGDKCLAETSMRRNIAPDCHIFNVLAADPRAFGTRTLRRPSRQRTLAARPSPIPASGVTDDA